MKNFIIYNVNTKEILRWGNCLEIDYESQVFDKAIEGIVEGQATSDIAYIDNNSIVFYNEKQKELKSLFKPNYMQWSNYSFSWEDTRGTEVVLADKKLSIDNQRSMLLQQSDWTQLPDVPLITQQKWLDYRQQLRDITLQPDYPNNVVWPIPPQ